MIEAYLFEKRHHYPHMMPEDRAIWERFIDKHPDFFDRVLYDVKVGSTPNFDTTVNEETGGNVDNLYKRKIDVVGLKDATISIVELKPRASTSAIGQVKGYAKLYAREFNPPEATRLIVITDQLLPDMDFLAKSEGVELIVV